MSTIVRVTIPDYVRARALYIAQILHVRLQDALGAMLLDAVQRTQLIDLETAVRGVMPQYRISLTEDADRDVEQDV